MKMTRTKLKSLVKECLVEILSEGIKSNESSLQEKRKRQSKQLQEEVRLSDQRRQFETKVEDVVSSITDDSVMQSILADTAKTTLQEQASQGATASSTSMSSGGSPGIDIGTIFEESSTNWTKLAFTDKE